MATFITLVNRFVGVRELAGARPSVWAQVNTPPLRPIANEDIFFYVKTIDNSNVVRAADPAAARARSRTVATGFLAASLVIAGLVPAAYNIMAGYTVQHLKTEQAQLRQQQSEVDLAEAQILNFEHLEKLAKTLRMVEPDPTQVEVLSLPDRANQTASAKHGDAVIASRIVPGTLGAALSSSLSR